MTITSNEWMQKAGELEAELERLRETLDICAAEKAVLREDRDRLREENERLGEEPAWAQTELMRLRRIEEAARVVLDEGPNSVAMDALRAALEEK